MKLYKITTNQRHPFIINEYKAGIYIAAENSELVAKKFPEADIIELIAADIEILKSEKE